MWVASNGVVFIQTLQKCGQYCLWRWCFYDERMAKKGRHTHYSNVSQKKKFISFEALIKKIILFLWENHKTHILTNWSTKLPIRCFVQVSILFSGMTNYLLKYEGCLKSSWTLLLLRVGTLWRYGNGLFFEVPPSASDAHLTTLYPLLENVLQTVDHFEISCLGAPFSWLEKPRNRMGRDPDCIWVSNELHFPGRTQNSFQISPHAISGLFQPWKVSSDARNFEMINCLRHVFEKWVEHCKKYIIAKGCTSKMRPSPHLHKFPSRSNNVSPWTLQTAPPRKKDELQMQ
jgi:hypothetical protein